jgi:hypothetical protein
MISFYLFSLFIILNFDIFMIDQQVYLPNLTYYILILTFLKDLLYFLQVKIIVIRIIDILTPVFLL